jgi:putative multiple sugar transport system substrate-binding protein
MKKKILSILLTAAMTASLLIGCGNNSDSGTSVDSGSQTPSADGSGLVGVCMQNMTSSISELEAEALKGLFEPQGYEVSIQDAGDDVSKQVSQVQNFILQGASMIVVLPCEIETLEDSLIEAREAGIKVVISGGTGSISEDAYDAVSADDEYVIGMWVASITKTYVEEYMDPNGDWTAWFCNSTISEDAISRCSGEFQIIEPYLKNEDGDYINESWQVVDEADKIDNPVYCQAIADRVADAGGISNVSMESDISGDNRTVIANILSSDANARVFIGYNSLISTAGSTYVLDTYSAEEASEFAFFSAGVMGDEYEYLIGAVSDGTAGTESVFRGAAQFGGGDAAATLASLCDAVMNGQEGVDYGKTNPNSIGLYFPVPADANGGNASLVFFDSPTAICCFSYSEVVAKGTLYWDSVNGYNESATESSDEELPADIEDDSAADDSSDEDAEYTAYHNTYAGGLGDMDCEFDLYPDGTVQFYIVGNEMMTDVYAGTYTQDGDTVTITGLTNVDASSSYTIPGLWEGLIDPATGDATLIVNEDGTCTAAE